MNSWARDAEVHANSGMDCVAPTTAAERSTAVEGMHAKMSSLQATAKANDDSAKSLDPMASALQSSHEDFLRAMQKMRVAESAKGGDPEAAEATAAKATSEFESARAALLEGLSLLPAPIADKWASQSSVLTKVEALPTSVSSVADVQACVAIASEKHRLASELQVRMHRPTPPHHISRSMPFDALP